MIGASSFLVFCSRIYPSPMVYISIYLSVSLTFSVPFKSYVAFFAPFPLSFLVSHDSIHTFHFHFIPIPKSLQFILQGLTNHPPFFLFLSFFPFSLSLSFSFLFLFLFSFCFFQKKPPPQSQASNLPIFGSLSINRLYHCPNLT